MSEKKPQPQKPADTLVPQSQIKIASFNLFNYLEPPNAFYEFQRIYSAQQWRKKQQWIVDYLKAHQPDVIGFQEVFSPDALKVLLAGQGYPYFHVVDQPQVADDFIYSHPVVAIASRYPVAEAASVVPDAELAKTMGLKAGFAFSRKVLRATVDLPHMGLCDCYVVHFKSKRPLFEYEPAKALSAEKNTLEQLKAQVAGGWGAAIQRGSEAALLFVEMISRRELSGLPMILMGDFNNSLAQEELVFLITKTLRADTVEGGEVYLEKYCLQDAWDMFQALAKSRGKAEPIRQSSHYYGAKGSVLDYILLSREFDAGYQLSLFEVSGYETYDRHLINPIFDRDGESSDHGILLVTLTLRE
ncbi:endonuclease/exonuclease/phosphatase family protein [Thalassomonas actiniarum]|uniref:endonuclease/exonuclease/phosphatase family protein n=1 Tax=Thalassomonas actiniarum TaxID=485447 RepID=UPI0007C83AF0|nr:endonuclease/exonuclease/phosphatase family protein [Thalassomonas actiniarum]